MVSCSLTTFPVVSPPPWPAAAVEVFERVLRLLPGATPRATCGAAECGAGPWRSWRFGDESGRWLGDKFSRVYMGL